MVIIDTAVCEGCGCSVPAYWFRGGNTRCKDCRLLTGKKVCTDCHQEKDLSAFYRKGDNYRSACIECYAIRAQKWWKENKDKRAKTVRKYSLRVLYNLSWEEFERRIIEQRGCCAICGKESALYVDHDHLTGQVRQLLCRQCNTGLGFFKDNIDLMQRAINYIEFWKSKSTDLGYDANATPTLPGSAA